MSARNAFLVFYVASLLGPIAAAQDQLSDADAPISIWSFNGPFEDAVWELETAL